MNITQPIVSTAPRDCSVPRRVLMPAKNSDVANNTTAQRVAVYAVDVPLGHRRLGATLRLEAIDRCERRRSVRGPR